MNIIILLVWLGVEKVDREIEIQKMSPQETPQPESEGYDHLGWGSRGRQHPKKNGRGKGNVDPFLKTLSTYLGTEGTVF